MLGFSPLDAAIPTAVYRNDLTGSAAIHIPGHEGAGHGIERAIWGTEGLGDAAFAALPDDIQTAFRTDLARHSLQIRPPGFAWSDENKPSEWFADAVSSYLWRGPWFRETYPRGAEAIRKLLNTRPDIARWIQFYPLPAATLLGLGAGASGSNDGAPPSGDDS